MSTRDQPCSLASDLSPTDLAALRGNTEPRIWTPPIRPLTPATSYGFAVIEFARDFLNTPLDPWEEWVVVHGGELLPDGRPRFRRVLLLVARQNGKTTLLKVLCLYWLFVQCIGELIVGMSTTLDYAKEAWQKVVAAIESDPLLMSQMPPTRNHGIRLANGEQEITTREGSRYKIATANRRGGRSLSIVRLVIDELREHDTWEAYAAAMPTLSAQPHGQAWLLSNQGDEKAIVLDSLRTDALKAISEGTTAAKRSAIFEYSAPDGCHLLDVEGWKSSNPNLGYRLVYDDLLEEGTRALANGGEDEGKYRIERLCQRVRTLDAAINAEDWAACRQPAPFTATERRRIAMCLDVSPDHQHATIVVAALTAGIVRIEQLRPYSGPTTVTDLARDLPQQIAKIKPRKLGWFPNGPAAALLADMDKRPGTWPPPGTELEELRSEVTGVCMGFAAEVAAHTIAHQDQQTLDIQILGASKYRQGDAWRFERTADTRVDAAFAAAGATYLARILPPPADLRLITTTD